ncbi:glutamate receptor ionotropic, kainate 5-like [Zootermopsis nevadensis]|uniref:glutamate receptor ionotropic, kainate 5-like n=1 Tax=Zootermopsis nevadensis TaxID=136037 RepID=UPI000B8ED264|nr:glutamate receptor ionotropic, kainate 5-like [Zootermopsis nevadensis]
MQRRMNFTTVYLRTEDRILGYKDQYGAWRGVVNELVTRKADVGINLLAMTTERLEAIDFLPPILNDRMMVHIRKDKMEISTVRHILSPFALKLWLAVSLVIIVFAVLLAVTAAINLKYSHEKVLALRHFSLQNSWWCVLGIFCQQATVEISNHPAGQDITPRSWSCRLVHATLCLTAAVLFAAYSATFVSFLTVRRYELPFSDFRGLLKNGKYRLGILHGSSTTNYFQKARDPILLDVYKKLIQPNEDSFVADDIEGLRNVCHSHNYAYVISIYNSIPALSKYIHCSITGVPEAYYSYTASIIITKDNPYKKLFQRHVQEMRRSGILNRIRKDAWWEDLEDDFRGASAGGTTLDTVTVFYHILAAGLLLSTFLVVLEKMWWKMRVQFRNKS